MKKILLGAVAGLIWLHAVCLILCPFTNYSGILAALGCVVGGVMLVGLGCTVALAVTNKKEDTDVRKTS